MVYYDRSLVGHNIDIKRGFNGSYYVYVNNKFYCSAENMREAEEEVEEYVKENSLLSLIEVV